MSAFTLRQSALRSEDTLRGEPAPVVIEKICDFFVETPLHRLWWAFEENIERPLTGVLTKVLNANFLVVN